MKVSAESFGQGSAGRSDDRTGFDRRDKVIKTLTGGVAGLMKKNQIDDG